MLPAGFALALGVLISPYIAIAQTPTSASPPHISSAGGVMPEYIEDFFLSEAVRSEDRGELQLTATSMIRRIHQSAADGSSAGLDFEYGLTDRLQLTAELPTASTPHHK